MSSTEKKRQRYVALLRGINVGGHKKVPMAQLKEIMEGMGFSEVKTLLNSGNVVFTGTSGKTEVLEDKISSQLESSFGFTVPVLIRKDGDINHILDVDPFKNIEVHKDIRLYIVFLKKASQNHPDLPWISSDASFRIIGIIDNAVCGVLDLSKAGTLDAMDVLGDFYGNGLTVRNWNTVVKIGAIL